MAVTDAILQTIAIQLTLDQNPFRAALGGVTPQALAVGNLAGEAFARQFGLQAGRGLGAWASTIGQIVGPSALGAGGFGLLGLVRNTGAAASGAAADLAYYRRQLEGIETAAGRAAGAQDVATRAINDTLRIANTTAFSNDDVFPLLFREAGRTGDVGRGRESVQNLLDAAASLGVQRQTFQRFSVDLTDLRNKQDRAANLVDIRQLEKVAPSLAPEIAKLFNIPLTEAQNKIRTISGQELTQAIEEIGKRNQGRAAQLANLDPREVAQNISDSAKFAFAPTGELLNRAFGPVGRGAQAVVNGFDRLNQATAGGAGLFLLAAGAAAGTRAVYGAAVATIRFTAALNAAAVRVAAGGAATAAGTAVSGATIGATANTAGRAAAASQVVRGAELKARTDAIVATAARDAAAAAKGGPGAVAALRASKDAAAVAAESAKAAAAVKATGAAAVLASKFAPLARFLPFLGAAGKFLGPLSLLIPEDASDFRKLVDRQIGGQYQGQHRLPESASKMNDAAGKLSDAADKLKDVAGGGKRTQREMSLLQMEFAGSALVDAQLGRAGITGVG